MSPKERPHNDKNLAKGNADYDVIIADDERRASRRDVSSSGQTGSIPAGQSKSMQQSRRQERTQGRRWQELYAGLLQQSGGYSATQRHESEGQDGCLQKSSR